MKIHYLLFSASLFACTQMSAQDASQTRTVEAALNEVSNLPSSHVGTMVSFSSKEDTKGSRYFFSSWVKGAVTGNNGVTINNDSISYNYDKISNSLYLTSDMKTMMELEKSQLKSFALKNSNGDLLMFEKLDNVHPENFVQVISKNHGKFSAYKFTQTKFEKANYHSDGLVETGKNYDEYVDNNEYYIVMPDNKEAKKIDLTKKSILKALNNNEKAKAYFSEHSEDDINEGFLKNLIESINN